ncbi:MAG TPA: hypothetical protein VJR24_09890 [Gemmatimonadaceae bacterium]|nr:hypothetical protein [Gemmatimonadaceae bacterium]
MRRIGVVLVGAWLVACSSSSTSVRSFGGAYDLTSVDGGQLPQSYYPGVSTTELRGGTLTVGPDTLVVKLFLQAESGGQPTGDVVPMIVDFPYARLGDSLYLPSDTSLFHDPLYLGGPPPPFGAIEGSDVVITLAVYPPVGTGVRGVARQFSFAPAR